MCLRLRTRTARFTGQKHPAATTAAPRHREGARAQPRRPASEAPLGRAAGGKAAWHAPRGAGRGPSLRRQDHHGVERPHALRPWRAAPPRPPRRLISRARRGLCLAAALCAPPRDSSTANSTTRPAACSSAAGAREAGRERGTSPKTMRLSSPGCSDLYARPRLTSAGCVGRSGCKATMDARFLGRGGRRLFPTPPRNAARTSLLRLKEEDHDGAEPSPSSIAAANLLRLAAILTPRMQAGRPHPVKPSRERGEGSPAHLGFFLSQPARLRTIASLPAALVASAACAARDALRHRTRARGPAPGRAGRRSGIGRLPGDLAAVARERLGRHRALIRADAALPWTHAMIPLASSPASRPVPGPATAYVCEEFACQPPVTAPGDLPPAARLSGVSAAELPRMTRIDADEWTIPTSPRLRIWTIRRAPAFAGASATAGQTSVAATGDATDADPAVAPFPPATLHLARPPLKTQDSEENRLIPLIRLNPRNPRSNSGPFAALGPPARNALKRIRDSATLVRHPLRCENSHCRRRSRCPRRIASGALHRLGHEIGEGGRWRGGAPSASKPTRCAWSSATG